MNVAAVPLPAWLLVIVSVGVPPEVLISTASLKKTHTSMSAGEASLKTVVYQNE